MYVSEQFNMYHLAYHLVNQDKFNILHIDFNANELWLNKYDHRASTVIRIIQRGFDWKNHLKIDISSVFQRVDKLKHLLMDNYLMFFNISINIYLSLYDCE